MTVVRASATVLTFDTLLIRPIGNKMLDVQFIRDNLDAVKTNCKNRNVTCDVDRVVQLDDRRRQLISETQVKQQRANEVSKFIPQTKDQAKKQELIAEGRKLREEVGAAEVQLKQV